jgi:hypothetical protein
MTYCCFDFHEVHVEVQSRSLNIHENASSLAGCRAEQVRATTLRCCDANYAVISRTCITRYGALNCLNTVPLSSALYD